MGGTRGNDRLEDEETGGGTTEWQGRPPQRAPATGAEDSPPNLPPEGGSKATRSGGFGRGALPSLASRPFRGRPLAVKHVHPRASGDPGLLSRGSPAVAAALGRPPTRSGVGPRTGSEVRARRPSHHRSAMVPPPRKRGGTSGPNAGAQNDRSHVGDMAILPCEAGRGTARRVVEGALVLPAGAYDEMQRASPQVRCLKPCSTSHPRHAPLGPSSLQCEDPVTDAVTEKDASQIDGNPCNGPWRRPNPKAHTSSRAGTASPPTVPPTPLHLSLGGRGRSEPACRVDPGEGLEQSERYTAVGQARASSCHDIVDWVPACAGMSA
ncbi:hypothetical protein SAMN02982931_00802 [Bauldia litoralis]|uniref:Uncharacterized protein n=1 Tax=Bauldia litoralis TaxID=665467 RepID=A0A1G6ALT8_9HYPH|nr:hypothetical protein SAMN02982931_00802 [Bauldia litoralis]